MTDDAAVNDSVRPEKKPRLNVEVPHSVKDSLTKLTVQLDISQTELLRRAIVLMEFAVAQIAKGNQLTVADKDLKVVTQIVGIW